MKDRYLFPAVFSLDPDGVTVFRDQMANRAVKKTLTIPKWLNDLAETKKVNFSHILQTALKGYLGVREPKNARGR